MVKRWLVAKALLAGIVLLLAGCAVQAAPESLFSPEPGAAPDPLVLKKPVVQTMPAMTTHLAAVSPVATVDGNTPQSTVRGFYDWYLGYAKTSGSPLVGRAYHFSDYLTAGFVQEVDKALASFTQGGFDPFFCAQDIPANVEVGQAQVTGDKAGVVARTSSQNHRLEVDLTLVNERWKISGIACSTDDRGTERGLAPASPDKVVHAFYDWYLASARRSGHPVASGAYRTSTYLSDAAIERIGQTWTGFGRGPSYDPVLCAQDMPESFTVDPPALAGDEASVFVRMHWAGKPMTSQTVKLKLAGDMWKIDDLTCAVQSGPGPTATAEAKARPDDATAGWQVFRDTEFGYEIKYPQGWTSFESNADAAKGSGPLARVTGFAPDDAPKGVVPASIEVYKGPREQFEAAFPGTGKFEDVEINGHKALFDRGDKATGVFYVFEAPGTEQVRIVFRYDPDAAPVVRDFEKTVKQMLLSLKFGK